MPIEDYNSNELSFKKQAATGTDPIPLSTTPHYRFGIHSQAFSFPKATSKMHSTYGGRKNVSAINRVNYNSRFTMGFVKTNGMPEFLALGAVANVDLGGGLFKHTVTKDDDAALQQIALRQDIRSVTSAMVKHHLDHLIGNLGIIFDDSNGDGVLVNTIASLGGAIVTPAFGDTPTTGLQDIAGDEVYKRDTNLSLIYDPTGDNLQLNEELLVINIQPITKLREIKSKSQLAPHQIVDGNVEYGVSMTFIPSENVRELFVDYAAELENDVADSRDWVFKIYRNTTQYIQYTLTGLHTIEPEIIHPTDENTERLYTVNALIESVSIEVVDTLNDAEFFGVA